MALQYFFKSTNPIDFPGMGYVYSSAASTQLRRMFYDTGAKTIMGLFTNASSDWLIPFTALFSGIFVMSRIWRAGNRFEFANDYSVNYYIFPERREPKLAPTNNGRIAIGSNGGSGHQSDPYYKVMADNSVSSMMYQMNTVIPVDFLTGVSLASYAILNPQGIGLIYPTQNISYNLYRLVDHSRILRVPGSAIMFSSVNAANWKNPKEIIYINSSRIAVTFRQDTNTNFVSTPYLIRFFNTTTTPWTLEFEDVLPGESQVATYDPANNTLYACGRNTSNAILYACRPKRAPVTVVAPSIIGTASSLREITATTIQTTVQDSQGSVISSYLVKWTLSASTSGGELASGYSLTNNSGVATIVYVGPRTPPAGLTEVITASVNDIEG